MLTRIRKNISQLAVYTMHKFDTIRLYSSCAENSIRYLENTRMLNCCSE